MGWVDAKTNNGSKLKNLFQHKKVKIKQDIVLNDTFELTTFVGSQQKDVNENKKPDYIGVEWVRSLYLFHYNNIIRKNLLQNY